MEIQKLTNEKMIHREIIDDLERRLEIDKEKMAKMQKEDSEFVAGFKSQANEELANFKRSLDKIGRELMCKHCWKLSTECLMLSCGHTLCSTCTLKIPQT